MPFENALLVFMEMAKEDPRIGPSHISLYISILLEYHRQGYTIPISVFSKVLMRQAKISAVGTYHKCMKDLKEYGYLKYVPSYNPVLGSLIYLPLK